MLIEVYSDVVCPWCYIGERRLSQALAQRPEMEVEVRWRPFQLRPEMPVGGIPWETMVEEKFGGMERARGIFERVTRTGRGEGLEFRFDRITRSPNTVDAHRLILLARDRGWEWEMADALFAAYFTEGRDLNDVEELVRISMGVGLDEETVRAYLAGTERAGEVMETQQDAYRSGIHSVPSYVINRRYLVQGAQEPGVFLQVFDAIEEEQAEAAPVAE